VAGPNYLAYGQPPAPDPSNPLTQGAPTLADAWQYNAQSAQNWINQQRAISAQQGLWGPQGITPQGARSAGGQMANMLAMATISPRVFHGTAQPGMAFEEGRPAFFSTDPGQASFYAETGMPKFVGDPKQPNVIPAYLDIKNPKTIEGLSPSESNAAFRDAQAAGHDGVILKNKGLPDNYVVFSPSQINPGFLKKYGIAALMAGGIAAGSQQ
jgi:hypothetical protein